MCRIYCHADETFLGKLRSEDFRAEKALSLTPSVAVYGF